MPSVLILMVSILFMLTGCATKQSRDGQLHYEFDPKYLVKTEVDRVVDTGREQVVDGMLVVAAKLYRRNPKEWKKGGFSDMEAALANLKAYRQNPPPLLDGKQEGAAALLAFHQDFSGDRVQALMYGLLTMIDAAFEHKNEFFILDALSEQKLYNCARNMEIVIWKLASARDEHGVPLLLSNEIGEGGRNLSFEREFGRAIGVLDLLAQVMADRNGRTVTTITHSVVTTLFLPVGLLK